MLGRLSLRLRVFLIFAGLTAGLLTVLAAALVVAGRRLGADAAPALVAGGALGVFGTLALVTWVWLLFDQNVARPIETLAGGLRTGAAPDAGEGRYLADLAPAAREAAEVRPGKPVFQTNCASGEGVDAVVAQIAREVLFDR